MKSRNKIIGILALAALGFAAGCGSDYSSNGSSIGGTSDFSGSLASSITSSILYSSSSESTDESDLEKIKYITAIPTDGGTPIIAEINDDKSFNLELDNSDSYLFKLLNEYGLAEKELNFSTDDDAQIANVLQDLDLTITVGDTETVNISGASVACSSKDDCDADVINSGLITTLTTVLTVLDTDAGTIVEDDETGEITVTLNLSSDDSVSQTMEFTILSETDEDTETGDLNFDETDGITVCVTVDGTTTEYSYDIDSDDDAMATVEVIEDKVDEVAADPDSIDTILDETTIEEAADEEAEINSGETTVSSGSTDEADIFTADDGSSYDMIIWENNSTVSLISDGSYDNVLQVEESGGQGWSNVVFTGVETSILTDYDKISFKVKSSDLSTVSLYLMGRSYSVSLSGTDWNEVTVQLSDLSGTSNDDGQLGFTAAGTDTTFYVTDITLSETEDSDASDYSFTGDIFSSDSGSSYDMSIWENNSTVNTITDGDYTNVLEVTDTGTGWSNVIFTGVETSVFTDYDAVTFKVKSSDFSELSLYFMGKSSAVELEGTDWNEVTILLDNLSGSSSDDGQVGFTASGAGTFYLTDFALGTSSGSSSSDDDDDSSDDTLTIDLGTDDYSAGDEWTLEWSDEFNGSSIDTSIWTHETGYGSGGWGNNEWQNYTDSSDNSYVQDGALVITAKVDGTAGYQDGSVTSARMITQDKLEFDYGKVAARIKVPTGQGIWPAFWMLGANFDTVGWADCGEIDIMEKIGGSDENEQTLHGTIHYVDSNDDYGNDGGSTQFSEYLSEDYHVYEVEWDESSIVWKVDGTQYHSVDISDSGYDEFRQEFFILLNVAVGGNWPGDPDSTTIYPQSMIVDWVRVYTNEETTDAGDSVDDSTFSGTTVYSADSGLASGVVLDAWSSGSTLTEITSDSDYASIYEVVPGDGWGASTSCIAFTELGDYQSNYNQLTFKVKSTDLSAVYVKIPEIEMSYSFTDGTDLGNDWYELTIPFSDFTGTSSDTTQLGIHGGYGNGGTFYVTDLEFGTSSDDTDDSGDDSDSGDSGSASSETSILYSSTTGASHTNIAEPGWGSGSSLVTLSNTSEGTYDSVMEWSMGTGWGGPAVACGFLGLTEGDLDSYSYLNVKFKYTDTNAASPSSFEVQLLGATTQAYTFYEGESVWENLSNDWIQMSIPLSYFGTVSSVTDMVLIVKDDASNPVYFTDIYFSNSAAEVDSSDDSDDTTGDDSGSDDTSGSELTVSSIVIQGDTEMTAGDSSAVGGASVTYSDDSIEGVAPTVMTWSSTNDSVAYVNDEYNLVAVAEGTATITGTYEGVSSTFTVTVSSDSDSDDTSDDNSGEDSIVFSGSAIYSADSGIADGAVLSNWDSGSTLTELTTDSTYSNIYEVVPGDGWGASTSCIAFTEVGEFQNDYNEVIFKVKSDDLTAVYVKIPEVEVSYDFSSGTDLGDGWYELTVPFSDFSGSTSDTTQFAIHGGWSNGGTFYVTDVEFGTNSETISDDEDDSSDTLSGPTTTTGDYLYSTDGTSSLSFTSVGEPGWGSGSYLVDANNTTEGSYDNVMEWAMGTGWGGPAVACGFLGFTEGVLDGYTTLNVKFKYTDTNAASPSSFEVQFVGADTQSYTFYEGESVWENLSNGWIQMSIPLSNFGSVSSVTDMILIVKDDSSNPVYFTDIYFE